MPVRASSPNSPAAATAVTAIARHPEKIAGQANVTPTKGDVMDQAGAWPACCAGHDAAISSVHFLASDPVKLIGAARDRRLAATSSSAAPAASKWPRASGW